MLSDVVRIWTSTNKAIPPQTVELLCCRHRSLQLPAPPSLSTIFSPHTALRLPGTPLEYYYIRAMEIHAIVMTLNLETSTQIATFEN